MLLVCIPMLLECTRTLLVCYSFVTRMLLVCTRVVFSICVRSPLTHKLKYINTSPSVSSNPVTLPDQYFDSFFYPVAPIVSSAGGIVYNNSFIYCLLSKSKLCLESSRLSPCFSSYFHHFRFQDFSFPG